MPRNTDLLIFLLFKQYIVVYAKRTQTRNLTIRTPHHLHTEIKYLPTSFRSAASFLLCDWRRWQDPTVYDALPQRHGSEHAHPNSGPPDLFRPDKPRKKDDQDYSAKATG